MAKPDLTADLTELGLPALIGWTVRCSRSAHPSGTVWHLQLYEGRRRRATKDVQDVSGFGIHSIVGTLIGRVLGADVLELYIVAMAEQLARKELDGLTVFAGTTNAPRHPGL